MRFDAPKYPSVSWESITFVTGAGDIHEVKLLDHATAISGFETPASLQLELSAQASAQDVDYYHVWFRDTRYTVDHTDAIVETQLAQDVPGGGVSWMYVGSVAGFRAGDWVYLERTGANEELVAVLAVDAARNRLQANVTLAHPAGSYVTLRVEGYHIAEKFAAIINDPGSPAGRYGPSQTAVVTAEGGMDLNRSGYLRISFKPDANYGKLGHLDRVLATSGHQGEGQLSDNWLQRTPRFTGGDTDKKYRLTLDFTQPLLDKNGQVVPMNDCRKIYLVFAPSFERIEEELEDGCFLTAAAAPGDTVLQVDGTSKLTGGRYFIGNPSAEERLLLVSVDSPTQITVQRGYENSTATAWPAGPHSGGRSATRSAAAPTDAQDRRAVTVRYSHPREHDLYLGTWLDRDAGRIQVTIDGGTYTFYVWARVPSGTRKVSLAIVNSGYTKYLAGPTQITLTTSWQRFKMAGTLASGQTGLWIVVRQFAANGDDWTTGDIHLWGTCLQQSSDPKKGYARTWLSQTPNVEAGLTAGLTLIAAPDDTTSPLKIHGPGSNLADSTLLELTANGELILAGGSGNGYRFAKLAAATNPSGWAGVIRVKTPAGATLGYILLYATP